MLLAEGSEAEQIQQGRKGLELRPWAVVRLHGLGGERWGRKSYGKVEQQLSPGMGPGVASSWDGPGGSCVD